MIIFYGLQKEIAEILMDSDFPVRPPNIFAKILAKKWRKLGQNFLEASLKNPSPLVSQEFPSVTPKIRIMENIDHNRSYKPLNEGHF